MMICFALYFMRVLSSHGAASSAANHLRNGDFANPILKREAMGASSHHRGHGAIRVIVPEINILEYGMVTTARPHQDWTPQPRIQSWGCILVKRCERALFSRVSQGENGLVVARESWIMTWGGTAFHRGLSSTS